MPITSHHIIRRQYLHVELNGAESDGLALQRSLPDLCRHWVTPALERVLERCAPSEGHLYIERLEIDAGVLTIERLEHDLAESVAQTLEKALREQILSHGPAAGNHSSKVQYKTMLHSIAEAFIFFLETGCLPWSFRLPEGRTLEQVLLDSWQKTAQSGGGTRGADDAVKRVLGSATARKRLVRQFSPNFLRTLLSRLSSEGPAEMDRIFQAMPSGNEPPVETQYFERLLWETVFARIAAGNSLSVTDHVDEAWRALPLTTTEDSALAGMMERHLPDATCNEAFVSFLETGCLPWSFRLPEGSTLKQVLLDSWQKTAQSGGGTRGVDDVVKGVLGSATARKRLVRQFSPVFLRTLPSRLSSEGPAVMDRIFQTMRSGNLPPVETQYLKPFQDRKGGEGIDAGEGFYIENAGMVILHPFLPQFFLALGIASEDKLLQPERALCLLHFLTTGKRIAPEFELVLPKILCNVPLETPVESDVELTASELEEANALLEAVIRHWEALRNTSPDGLRGTFLLRPGKVSLRDGDWLLQVESKTWDILLEQLPWSISMIKLPWMERMLWVEWNSYS